jgi:N-carbamoylputrescine amidase
VENNIQRGVNALKNAARQGARLVVFPELSFTRFHPQHPAQKQVSDLAEPIPGPMVEIFSDLARKLDVAVIFNLFERAGERTYDSSPVIDTDGSLLGVTRMIHICETPGFHEQGYYHPGEDTRMVYETSVGRIGVAICYDRHFPEYMRRLGLLKADLVVIPQAGAVGEWPPGLFEAECQVAGFQNGYFTALCNRVGREERLIFEGKSFVTSPGGQIVSQAPSGEDAVLLSEIDLSETGRSHARRHFMIDRRPFLYDSWDPDLGHAGEEPS